MILSKKFTTVTPFSKFVALTIFILFPIFGFYLGKYYQYVEDTNRSSMNTSEILLREDPMILEARKDLAFLVSTTPDKIEILKVNDVTWLDTCLGGPRHSRCGVVTDVPGYQVLFRYKEKIYEYHTGGEYYTKIVELGE